MGNADRHGAEAERNEFNDETGAYSDRTTQSYTDSWKVFERFCATQGLVPLPASPDTVLAFIGAAGDGALRRPGKGRRRTGARTPASASWVDVVLSAVRHAHLSAGYDSPTAHPAVRAVRQQYRTEWAAANPPERAAPLTLDALRACATYQPEVDLGALTKAAVALLLLDTPGASARTLAGLQLADLRCGEQVDLRIGGQWRTVECSCSPWAAHWRDAPCAACMLRRLERSVVDEDGPLFGNWPASGRAKRSGGRPRRENIVHLARTLPTAWPALAYRAAGALDWASPDEQVRAATRHGIGLALAGQLSLLQMRLLLVVAFARGLRFSDATRLDYGSLTRLPGGYRLHLPVSKGDQAGMGRWLHVKRSRECALCAVCALDEWLWLRRAATPPVDGSGALICPVKSTGFRPDDTLDYGTTWMHLRTVRDGSGAGEFSLHSMRRGFARLATDQGAGLDELRDVLGHRKLDTTRIYIDPAEQGELPAAPRYLAGKAVGANEGGDQGTARARPDEPHDHSDHWEAGIGRCRP